MAGNDDGATPPGEQVVDACATVAVEVVGGLVEDGDAAAPDLQSDQRDEHRLAAREGTDATVQPEAEPRGGELLPRAGLDVPRVSDHVEVPGIGVTPGDGPQRGELGPDPEQVSDLTAGRQCQVLGQQIHSAVPDDGPRGGGEFTGDEPQQRRLA